MLCFAVLSVSALSYYHTMIAFIFTTSENISTHDNTTAHHVNGSSRLFIVIVRRATATSGLLRDTLCLALLDQVLTQQVMY